MYIKGTLMDRWKFDNYFWPQKYIDYYINEPKSDFNNIFLEPRVNVYMYAYGNVVFLAVHAERKVRNHFQFE